jgi:CheY-like chemotaxis protein
MSSAQPATDNGTVLLPLEREEILKRFRRALLIDDEVKYASSVKQNLELMGFETTVSSSIDAGAQELLTRSYPIIICDNVFGQPSNRRGSEFIRDHANLLRDGRVVLMTGFPEKHIVDFELLSVRGVKFIRKGSGAIEELKRYCREAVNDRAQEFTEYLGNVCRTLISDAEHDTPVENFTADDPLITRARTYLVNYMKKFPNPELAQFSILGRAYSPLELIHEIEQRSEVSTILIDQLLDDILESPDE